MPGVQYVVVPRVYNNLSAAESEAQTDPVVDEIVKLLTSGAGMRPSVEGGGNGAVAVADVGAGEGTLRYSGGDYIDVLESFNDAFLDRDWGDGYPLLPPTVERVEALLTGVDGGPDDLVCVLPPGNGYATVRKVAVGAAMAGCLPEEMPVVMAALRAIAKAKQPGARMALMSTSATAPLFLVNGPIARELGINGGRACLGPGKQNEVNIRIGRAAILCLKNLGAWYPGIMDMDTIGTTRKFSLLLAENEQESPWEPYHVSRGYEAHESTVSLFFTGGEQDIGFQGHVDATQLAKEIAASIGGRGGGNFTHFIGGTTEPEGGRLLLLPPPHAIPLAEGGFSRWGLQQFLQQHVDSSVDRLIETDRVHYRDGKVRKEWEWLFELEPAQARRTYLPLVPRAMNFHIVVAGSVRAKDLVHPCGPPSIERITRTPDGS